MRWDYDCSVSYLKSVFHVRHFLYNRLHCTNYNRCRHFIFLPKMNYFSSICLQASSFRVNFNWKNQLLTKLVNTPLLVPMSSNSSVIVKAANFLSSASIRYSTFSMLSLAKVPKMRRVKIKTFGNSVQLMQFPLCTGMYEKMMILGVNS